MAIRILKLLNGDNVICELIEILNGEYRVRNVLRIIENYNKKQKAHNIFLVQWLPYTQEVIFRIPKNHVVVMVTPTEGMPDHYYRRVDEVFGFPEDEIHLTEEDILLLQDFEDAMAELPDDDDIIH